MGEAENLKSILREKEKKKSYKINNFLVTKDKNLMIKSKAIQTNFGEAKKENTPQDLNKKDKKKMILCEQFKINLESKNKINQSLRFHVVDKENVPQSETMST